MMRWNKPRFRGGRVSSDRSRRATPAAPAMPGATFEALEQRVLLSTAFHLDFVNEFASQPFTENVVVASNGAYAFRAFSSDPIGWHVFRGSFGSTQPPQKFLHPTGPQGSTLAFDMNDDGWLAISGGFPGLPGSAIGLFPPHATQASTVIYGDLAAPTATVEMLGSAGAPNQVRITVTYSDNAVLDSSTIRGENVRITGPGFQGTAALVGSPAGTYGKIQAVYHLSVPPWEPGTPLPTYTIELVENQVRDEAGNAAAARELASFSPGALGAWSPTDPPTGDASLPWPTTPWRGTIDTIGQFTLAPTGSTLAFPAWAMSASENHMVWWTGSQLISSPLPGATVQSGAKETAMAASGRTVARTGLGEIIVFNTPGSPAQVLASAGEFADARSPAISRDGSAIAFQARPAGQPNAAHGIFASIQGVNGGHAFRASAIQGDNQLELDAGERFLDANGDGQFSPGTHPTGFSGSLVVEDVGVKPGDGPMAVRWMPAAANQPAMVRIAFTGSSGDLAPGPASHNGGVYLLRLAVTQGTPMVGVYEEIIRDDLHFFEDEGGQLVLSRRGFDAEGRLSLVATKVSSPFEKALIRATEIGLRPVLLLPGILGTFPLRHNYEHWVTTRGVHPEIVAIDPLAATYDNMIRALENAGYVRNVTLFVATYDWRIPPAPMAEGTPTAEDPYPRTFDGVIQTRNQFGMDPQHFVSEVFASGLDYLRYWMLQAMDAWEAAHQVPLDKVDIIAHSTGAVIARAYMQSDIYNTTIAGGRVMPGVAEFVSIGMPSRGASKAWNPLHDNFSAEMAYKVLQKSMYFAYKQVHPQSGGGSTPIAGPADDVITWNRITTRAAQLKAHDQHPLNADHRFWLPRSTSQAMGGFLKDDDHYYRAAFIELYVPTLRALLATYDFLVDEAGNLSNVNSNPWLRNALALDLNAGIDLTSPHSPNFDMSRLTSFDQSYLLQYTFTFRSSVTIIYGDSRPTMEFVQPMHGPSNQKLLRNMGSSITRTPFFDELYYYDVPPLRNLGFGQGGDETVPTQSGGEQYWGSPFVSARRFTGSGTDHAGLLANRDVQRVVLKTLLGRTDLTGINTSTGLQGPTSYALRVMLMNDPAETIVVDSEGRRWGWSEATGPLQEIPGSVYYGGADGIGWIIGDPGPLQVFITGMGQDHLVQLMAFHNGVQVGEIESEGFLAAGETVPPQMFSAEPQLNDPALPFRLFYPEGWRNDLTIEESIVLFNPHPHDVTVRLFAHYEHGHRDALLAQITLPAGGRYALVLSSLENPAGALVRKNVGYAIQIQSSDRIDATMIRRDDFGNDETVESRTLAGHSFTDAPASQLFFPGALRRSGEVYGFLVFFNPLEHPTTVRLSLRFEGGAIHEFIYTLNALRRGGLALHQLDGLPDGSFAITIDSDTPIIAALSQYEPLTASGFTALGRPAIDGPVFIPGITTDQGTEFHLRLFNLGPESRDVSVTILSDSGDPPITLSFIVPAGQIATLNAADLGLTESSGFTLRVDGGADVLIAAGTRWLGTGGSLVMPVAHQPAEDWIFAGEPFGHTSLDAARTGRLLLTNPGETDIEITLSFHDADGGITTRNLTIAPGRTTTVDLLQEAALANLAAFRDLAIHINASGGILASLIAWDPDGTSTWSTTGNIFQ